MFCVEKGVGMITFTKDELTSILGAEATDHNIKKLDWWLNILGNVSDKTWNVEHKPTKKLTDLEERAERLRSELVVTLNELETNSELAKYLDQYEFQKAHRYESEICDFVGSAVSELDISKTLTSTVIRPGLIRYCKGNKNPFNLQ